MKPADMCSPEHPAPPLPFGTPELTLEPKNPFIFKKNCPALDPSEPNEPKQSPPGSKWYQPNPFWYSAGPCKPLITGIHSIDNNRVAHPTQSATTLPEALTTARIPLFLLLACCCISTAAFGGILVSRNAQGLQFTDAIGITVNTKDKALSLGDLPKLAGPIGKLPAGHLNGILIMDSSAGVLSRYEQGKVEYLLPQGLPKTAPDDPAAIWKSIKIAYKKSAQDKAGTEIPSAEFVAFLPSGAEELTRLCTDEGALQLIGGKGKTFPAQIQLMSAVVKSYASNPAMAPLGTYVSDAMRRRYDQFESGAAGLDALTEGLKFVELSAAVYPADPEQDKLRKQLTNRKQWLDRKSAILRAFAAGEQWDAFLLGDREFERYQQSFPDMAAKHGQALKESLQLHMTAAAQRKDDGDFGAAYREYRLASFRKPSDAVLREDSLQAWTEYSRRVATDRHAKRVKLQPGPQSTVDRYLYNADQYRTSKNLDEAFKSVTDGEAFLHKSLAANAVSLETLKILFKKAEILGAQDRTSEALVTLDEYDLHAVDEERAPAEKLRNQLLFNLNTSLKDLKAKLQAAWAEGSYNRAYQLSLQGLKMKSDDADLLYQAGMSAAIVRKPKESREYLNRYLEISNTLDARPEERAQVRRVLPLLGNSVTAAVDGDPNWLSGNPVPKGAFYCPTSIAFQPHIDRIDASNKLKTSFEWDGEKLKSVTPNFDKNEHVTPEKKISVGYDDRSRQVVWASDTDEPRPALPADPDDAYRRASLLLPNSPYVDPLAIQKLTGKNVTLGISGNRFFNPFVWEKLYYFRFTYDDRGRVATAQEVNGPKGAPTDLTLEFEWSGMQLTAIRGFQAKAKVYERTMQYVDGKLVAEDIQGAGKPSRIKYAYAGNRLVSAESTNDASSDNRSRKIAFAGASPSTQVK